MTSSRLHRLLAAAAALVAAAACGGHSSGGGGGTLQGPNGGTVTLQYSTSSPYALAVFVSSSGDFTPVPSDGCLAMSTAGTPADTHFLDGGATLTFTGG
ncbi:MAG TPA: hypothetical protein VMV18_13590, partial [bacterium]|nr:hypothetical protein [bacterium]